MNAASLRSPQDAARWLRARVSGTLRTDSRQVRAGDGFIAWPGARTDARRHVPEALRRGASACVVEFTGIEPFGLAPSAAIATYADLKAACGPIASAYYGEPSRALRLIAVTGTNGKTSTAWWLAAALSALNRPDVSPCAMVGTLGVGTPPRLESTGLTTPDPVLLQRCFSEFARAGTKSCALEASSIGLVEHRLAGTAIDVAVFTNFTQDHLDYHGTMGAYWRAKRDLFDWPGLSAAVVNLDDPKGPDLATHARERGLDVWTVSLQAMQGARLSASDLHHSDAGLTWRVREADDVVELNAALVGAYNATNLMGVVAVLRALGVPLTDAARACADLPAVPGRMERVVADGAPLAIVDYAHTPDALDKALQALRPLARHRGGRLWCLLGCGGNRDPGKRPLMAAAAERGADRLVLTSDNPRDEDPLAIIAQMRPGLRHPDAAQVEPDRARAIADVLSRQAAPDDVVLIAGKGHERYQEVAGARYPFSDRAHARAALRAHNRSQGRPT